MSKYPFTWICGDKFRVELTPGKRVLHIFAKEPYGSGEWQPPSRSVKSVQLIARGRRAWTKLGLKCGYTCYTVENEHFRYPDAARAPMIARRVLKSVGLGW